MVFSITRLLIFLCVLTYDTPFYCLQAGDKEESRKVVCLIYKHPDQEYTNLEIDLERLLQNDEKKSKSKGMLSPQKRRGLTYGIIVGLFFTGCGINLIILYSIYIFQIGMEDPKDRTPQIFTFLCGFLNMATSYITGFIIEKCGRKPLLFIGNLVLGIPLGLITVSAAIIPLGFLLKYLTLIFISLYSVTIGAVVFIYLSDILDEQGIGIAMLFS